MPRPDHPDVFSTHHRQHAVPDLLPAGVVVAGAPARDAVVGCQLVGGGLMVAATLAAHTVVRHQRRHLAHVAADDINVLMLVDGSASVEASGQRHDLHGGDILYLPAHGPSTLETGAACRMLVLRLSFRRFCNGQDGKFSDFRIALARRNAALSRAVFHYVQHVLPSLGDSALATVVHAEQAFIALLAAVYAEVGQTPEAAMHSRWEQLVLAVDARLHDADLDVAALAAALAITPRHVHRLFAANGERCGTYLLAQRLARAREDLRRPMLAGIGVAQIGYRAGFNSASHFSRSFKQRYGIAPQAWRTQAG